MSAFEVIHESIMKYLDDNWVLGAGRLTAIDWWGIEFDTDAVDEWLQPRLLNRDEDVSRDGAENDTLLLDINVFVRAASNANLHRALYLADQVTSLFRYHNLTLIGNGAVIRFEKPKTTVIPLPIQGRELREGGSDERLQQVNVSIEGRITA